MNQPSTTGQDIKAFFTSKRDKLAGRYKWLAFPAILLLAPVSYFIAYALFGATLALASGGLLGLTWLYLVNMWPKWSMQLANYRLRALKAEAERNPIETLQNQQMELEAGLKVEAEKITKLDASVEDYRAFLIKTEETEPDAAAAGLPVLRNMERLLIYRRQKWAAARTQLQERARKIASADAKYRVALAAQAVTKAAGESQQSVLAKILEDIAFGAVDSTVNTSMAELRTAIMVEEVPDGEVIEMATPTVNEADRKSLRLALAAPQEVIAVRQQVKLGVPRNAIEEIQDIRIGGA